jgi:DNA-binding response OmpR family regulator
LHAVRTFDCSLAALRHLEAEFARCRDTVGATTPIVIVDGHMPELDGFGLLEALRALPGGGEGTLIMLSGSQDPEDRVRALGCGADEYLLKFPDAETLRRAVEKSRSVHAG